MNRLDLDVVLAVCTQLYVTNSAPAFHWIVQRGRWIHCSAGSVLEAADFPGFTPLLGIARFSNVHLSDVHFSNVTGQRSGGVEL